MEFLIMMGIIGGYGLLGVILLTLIFLALLGIDLIFRTHFGRRIVRRFIEFIQTDYYEEA